MRKSVANLIGLGVLGLFLTVSTIISAQDNSPDNGYVTTYRNASDENSLNFSFVQAGAKGTGEFNRFDVILDLDADKTAPVSLRVDIDVTSLDTGDEERDEILRSQNLFHIEEFPIARFASEAIIEKDWGYIARGRLTIRGVSKRVSVPLKVTPSSHMYNNDKAFHMKGKLVINRFDFGVGKGEWSSDAWVGKNVTISYELNLSSS